MESSIRRWSPVTEPVHGVRSAGAGPSVPPARSWSSRSRRAFAVVTVIALVLAAAVGLLVGRETSPAGTPGVSSVPPWRSLPAAPIGGRSFESVAWTGKELIVAGGLTSGSPDLDGAAYDPALRAWRPTARLPGPLVDAPAVWTGRVMLVWAGNGLDGPVVAAAYDPRADRWTRLPDGPLGPREGYAAIWTGRELVVMGGNRGEAPGTPVAAALDPAKRNWRVLHGLDGISYFGGPSGAVWDGRDAILTGNVSLCPERGVACDRFSATVVAFDPRADTARSIPLPAPSTDFGSDTAAGLRAFAWTGTEVVFTAGAEGTIQLLRWNPTVGSWPGQEGRPCHVVADPALGHGCRDWRLVPRAPCYEAATQTAWLGDRFVAACAADGLQIYGLAGNAWSWRTIVPGPSPFNDRDGSAIVWTGRELIAWSGSERAPRNPTPADGMSVVLPG